jgi:hypothetical protein
MSVVGHTLPERIPSPLLNEHQAAKLLGWSVFTLQQRRFRCQAPNYIKLGGKSVRYELLSLEEFIAQSRVSLGDTA